MANPTTNFGWVMPTTTDLVTDLPADFNTFGQGVDTSMAELLGGTTGQILSKTSNTDMDFTWIANDVGDITAVNTTAPLAGGSTSGAVTLSVTTATTSATGVVQLSDSTSTTSSVLAATPTAVKSAYDLANAAIPTSTVTTAGDVIYRNATVPTRLGIGTAGQVLTVNSGATAPEWTTAASTGALTLIGTTTFTATASASVNSVFTSTYEIHCPAHRKAAGGNAGFPADAGNRAPHHTNWRRPVCQRQGSGQGGGDGSRACGSGGELGVVAVLRRTGQDQLHPGCDHARAGF